MYSNDPLVKQLLTRIPQLGSSTSSTDSSPSPIAHKSMLKESRKVPALIKEFQMSMPDDKDWQSQLFGLLKIQTYDQCEVDGFALMCRVIDNLLHTQVNWARNSIFFKELQDDDQKQLFHQSWSDMLILDLLHQRLHHGLPEEFTMPNNQKFNMVNLALLGVASMQDQLNLVLSKLQELKFDPVDYICLKFLLLFSPAETKNFSNIQLVHAAYERTQQSLMEYTLLFHPQINDKFTHMLGVLPEIHFISERGKDYLLYRHRNGSAPCRTLLMEMLRK